VDAKAAIEETLKETEFSDVRPAKMSVDELLKYVYGYILWGLPIV
jgi:hypothetical protein